MKEEDAWIRQSSVSFFYWQFFAKFRPEKHDLERTLHGGKKTQIRQNSNKKLNPSSQILMINSSLGSAGHRRIFFFFYLLPYLVCSQIWVNVFLDDATLNISQNA
jgi:hypothetical protein